ncbi:MAG: hypothetical protein EZS28_010690 [Streblomastix strix]|uniref:Uncharacterized protein n=1 Tax=Streblomastix strix TaxID=222440 RepID=A0A5J4WGI2_9EUKA|nr:MAG: hypothetical protein EZS28_010690 [Streblomastix strix]
MAGHAVAEARARALESQLEDVEAENSRLWKEYEELLADYEEVLRLYKEKSGGVDGMALEELELQIMQKKENVNLEYKQLIIQSDNKNRRKILYRYKKIFMHWKKKRGRYRKDFYNIKIGYRYLIKDQQRLIWDYRTLMRSEEQNDIIVLKRKLKEAEQDGNVAEEIQEDKKNSFMKKYQ